MDELVSVIIPVYNVEEYVADCIISVINQSYHNMEIIIVDDGSTDKSGIICDEFKNQDSRITVIHKDNGGLSDARNAGLEISKGAYVLFVDSDDYVDCEMIRILYDMCKNQEADIAFCKYDEVGERGQSKAISRKVYDECYEVNAVSVQSEKYLESIFTGSSDMSVNWSVCVRLYKMGIVKKIRFDKGKCFEDILYSTKAILNANKCVYINKALYHYRYRAGSITNVNTSAAFDRRIVTDLLDQEEKVIGYLQYKQWGRLAQISKAVFYQQMLYYASVNPYEEYDDVFNKRLKDWRLTIFEIVQLPVSTHERIKIVIKMYMPMFSKRVYKNRTKYFSNQEE